MDKDEFVGASPEALRWLNRIFVATAVQIHDLAELARKRVTSDPPMNTPPVLELNEQLVMGPLHRMRTVATSLVGMATYLNDRADYQDLISSGKPVTMRPPQYDSKLPEDNTLLNLGVGGLQLGGGLAGAAGALALAPEPLVSKIAAAGIAIYSLFVAEAGVRTLASGGATVAEPYPDQGVEWAALRAGASPENATAIKNGFALGMGVGAPLGAELGMMRASIITKTASQGARLATATEAEDAALFSRSGALSNRDVQEQGIGLPRTTKTVDEYTRLAEVDFRGAPVEIVEDADTIAYLDYQQAVARTDRLGVQLGPASFLDEETLVRTLGHESVHIKQYIEGRVTSLTEALENEAYAAEDGFVETWRKNKP